jgi:hypothetical protein
VNRTRVGLVALSMTVRDYALLASIGEELADLARRDLPPGSHEIRALRLKLHECERSFETYERRIWQAEEIEKHPDEPVRWLGDIYAFTEDLVYAAKRLNREIRGVFNDVQLAAKPSSAVSEVLAQYRDGFGRRS